MKGIGTIVNSLAIIAGSILGILFKKGISEKLKDIIFSSVGVSVAIIGLLGVINNQGDAMLLVLSLVSGSVIGELIDFEARMEVLGEKLKKAVSARNRKKGTNTPDCSDLQTESAGADSVDPASAGTASAGTASAGTASAGTASAGAAPAVSGNDERFVEGFVNASIIFCVGAMAIVGSLNDGLLNDPSTLFTKSILDGVTSIVLASALGIGVAFSAVPIFLYQGLITLLAGILAPVLTDALIRDMSFVGNTIIFCIGLNFILPKRIKAGNMFPAMFMPILIRLITG